MMKLATWYPVEADRTMHCHKTNFGGKRNIGQVDTIVIHYTGNDGDTAENNAKYFQGANRNTSAHFFVDEKEVIQSVFMDEIAWHVTGHNTNTIGIEMCSYKDEKGNYQIAWPTQDKAAELASLIMLRYNITNVVRHYDLTGKNCPEPFVRDKTNWYAFTKLLYAKVVENRYRYSCKALRNMGFLTTDDWLSKDYDGDYSYLMHKIVANLPEKPLEGWK